jgi:hypothetical protein
MSENAINEIEGGKGNSKLKTVRHNDDELDTALTQPLSVSDSRNRATEAKITRRLSKRDWSKTDIRKVLMKRNDANRDDDYFRSVLVDAGYNRTRHRSDDDDDSGVTTDSDVDASRFKNVTF